MAGDGVRGARMEPEGDAQGDPDVAGLPDVVAGDAGRDGEGPGEPQLLEVQHAAPHGGGGAGLDPGGDGDAQPGDVPPQFAELDAPDTDASCPVRFTTIVPTQALGFLNSGFMNDQAKVLAHRLRREAGEDEAARMRLGLELALARPATGQELAIGGELLEVMRTQHGLDEDAALERFALFLLNLNEFIFLD